MQMSSQKKEDHPKCLCPMKKQYVLLLFLLATVITAGFTQDTIIAEPAPVPEEVKPQKPKKPLKERIYYGGYINASFGTYTSVGVEPMIAFKVTPKFSVGVKFRYDYIRDNRYGSTYNTSNYGGSIFTRYRLFKPLYVHLEYATYNYDLYYGYGESERQWIPYFFVGGGYSKMIGKRTWLNAQVLFDVLQDENSPYRTWEPFYSLGVGVGF